MAIAQEYGSVLPDLHIIHGDILNLELASIFTAPAHSKILVVGNPPWVTNAELGGLNYDNLPEKTNFKQLSGLDALTGHSNFDIAEYIIIKLIHELSHSDATIALICKTGVARNVIRYCYDKNLAVSNLAMYKIDAKKWFDASVSACLFVLKIDHRNICYDVRQFNHLSANESESVLKFENKALIANTENYQTLKLLDGNSPIEWRQGLKHDSASVMELKKSDEQWVNKNGEIVDIEDDYIYPLIKSSDVRKVHPNQLRNGN